MIIGYLDPWGVSVGILAYCCQQDPPMTARLTRKAPVAEEQVRQRIGLILG